MKKTEYNFAMKKLYFAVALIVVAGAGYYFLYQKSSGISERGGNFTCSSDYYVKMSNNGHVDVIDFGKVSNPIPSKIYVASGGVFTIYHDDQYDPAEQKEHIPALYQCTRDGKNVFDIYDRSPEKFEATIKASHRNDPPSQI